MLVSSKALKFTAACGFWNVRETCLKHEPTGRYFIVVSYDLYAESISNKQREFLGHIVLLMHPPIYLHELHGRCTVIQKQSPKPFCQMFSSCRKSLLCYLCNLRLTLMKSIAWVKWIFCSKAIPASHSSWKYLWQLWLGAELHHLQWLAVLKLLAHPFPTLDHACKDNNQ